MHRAACMHFSTNLSVNYIHNLYLYRFPAHVWVGLLSRMSMDRVYVWIDKVINYNA